MPGGIFCRAVNHKITNFMRTEIKTINLYKFNELSEEAQKKAIQNNDNINICHDWYEFIIDEWNRKLESLGFDQTKIAFSGFWSQGDGASFTAKSINVETWIKQNSPDKYKRILKLLEGDFIGVYSSSVVRNKYHSYCHENTVSAYIDFRMYGNRGTDCTNVGKLLDELHEDIEDSVRSLSQDIYSELQKEYEYQTSEEAIIETIEANGYEFTEEGKIY